MNDPQRFQSEFFGPLVKVWEQRIEAAKRAREPFDTILDQCEAFYGAISGFMFEDSYNQKYFRGNLPTPKFKICINRAWEYVSIIGPSLFWDYPFFKFYSHREFLVRPELFGDPNDPQSQQMFQQFAMQEEQELIQVEFRNRMMQAVVNWGQREQPNGLASQGLLTTTQALLSGRGVLWPETYKNPGSEEIFVMLRHGDVRDLLIDADCCDPMLETAGYIMRRHVNPIWQVERMFQLPRGSLKGKGKYQSKEQSSRNQASNKGTIEFDCIEWYEIWSRIGIGPHLVSESLLDEFDEVVGDYAYLCIAPGVSYPLNAPADKFFGENALTPEEVAERFEWRTPNYGESYPIWKDQGRFPVSLLDFNPLARSAWPLSPLANGIGYLICLNVLISTYVDRAWTSRTTLIGYLKSAAAEIEKSLKTDSAYALLPINDNIHQAINDIVSVFEMPGNKDDILQAIAMMSDGFDKSVGLSELSYGSSTRQIRVAADVRERTANLSVRPDKMARDVAAFMTNAGRHLMVLSAMHIAGQSIVHLVGQFAAQQWDAMKAEIPIEQILREMKTTVEASEIRRPNKERDTANVQSLQQYLLPLLQAYAQTTGNTEPLNKFMEKMGDAIEMKMADIQLPPWTPPQPDEQTAQIQQQAQMVEIDKTSSESELNRAKAAAEIVGLIQGDTEEAKHLQQLQFNEEIHDQKLIHNAENHAAEMLVEISALKNEP